MTDTPEPTGPPEPGAHATGDGSLARLIGLAVVGFAATLVLLFGIASLVGGPPTGDPSEAIIGPSAAVVGSGTPSASGPAVEATSRSTPPVDGATSSPTAATSSPAAATPSPEAGTPSPASPSSAPGPDPVLIGAGDIAACGLPADGATAELVAGIAGTVFTAGDNAYDDGSLAQFRRCYDPTWGRFRSRTRPAPGNHDHNTKDLAGYRAYFGAAAGPDGTSWYSYDLGTWHIVVLDSSCSLVGGCGPTSDQGRWLTADLAASSARCTMAIWHHPRFSSGVHGSDPSVGPFWRALYDAGADVVVNGHDHDYERFAPQDPAGARDGARGLREFVVGTGGAALRDFPTAIANSRLRSSIAHGVIRFDLHPTGYDWQFITTSGTFTDSGSAACH